MSEHNKTLSCGILVVDADDQLLMLHATGQHFWDLPKGTQDLGETPLETALRELKEETDLDASADQLIELGWMPYNRYKDLWLFVWPVESLDLSVLACHSTFVDNHGQERPEADAFQLVPLNTASGYMCNSLARLYEQELHQALDATLSRYRQAA